MDGRGQSSRGSNRGDSRGRGGYNGRRGGRFPWRWGYNKRVGSYRGRGRGGNNWEDSGEDPIDSNTCRGRGGYNGYNYNHNNNFRDGSDDDSPRRVDDAEDVYPPPSKRRKRVDAVQTIKFNVEKQWRQALPGYDVYYYDSPPQLPEVEKKISAVEVFLIQRGLREEVLTRGEETEIIDCFPVSFEEVAQDELFCLSWPEFESDLVDDPDETISLWSVTAHKIIYNAVLEQEPSSEDSEPGKPPVVPKILIGFLKQAPVTPLTAIKSSLLGKFVTVRGAVVRAGNTHPYCQRLTFRCKICDAEFAVVQPDGKYFMPTRCRASDECPNSNLFEPLEGTSTTVMVDSRRIRVQDMQNYEVEQGAVPRIVECELFGSLADLCTTGDAVTLSGIVRMSRDVNYVGEQSLHRIYIEVSSVRQHKDSDRTMGGHLFSFTNKDYYAIWEIHDTPNLFRLLIASLCPSIYGHELVKAGLLLCLFGGAPRYDTSVIRRSDINMLMVGDPGIGKSQMLRAVTEVAPRSVYICGTGSTVAGLTVTLVKEGDDYSLEAGALVMADKGVCCIDEFDKMASQHHALLEALEQQTVSVAKSGVFRTLPARTSVMSAANPVGGHYDCNKTEFDQKIVDHILGVASETVVTKLAAGTAGACPSNSQVRRRLIDKMKMKTGEMFDVIPHDLLRKYIAYAKQYVHPQLSAEARQVLQKYYLNLRLSHRDVDSTPVTARQLESLIRLTEARAKIELREIATAEDAGDILEIFEFSIQSAYDSEVLAISALSSSVLVQSTGKSKSQSIVTQAKQLVKALNKCAERQSKNIFSVDEIRQVASGLGFQNSTNALIAALNNEGYLLNKGGKTYKLQMADY